VSLNLKLNYFAMDPNAERKFQALKKRLDALHYC